MGHTVASLSVSSSIRDVPHFFSSVIESAYVNYLLICVFTYIFKLTAQTLAYQSSILGLRGGAGHVNNMICMPLSSPATRHSPALRTLIEWAGLCK